MPWGTLRAGLLEDLGFESAADMARTIGYDDVPELERALAGEAPSDELMSALLRHYLSIPPLYFVTATPQTSAA